VLLFRLLLQAVIAPVAGRCTLRPRISAAQSGSLRNASCVPSRPPAGSARHTLRCQESRYPSPLIVPRPANLCRAENLLHVPPAPRGVAASAFQRRDRPRFICAASGRVAPLPNPSTICSCSPPLADPTPPDSASATMSNLKLHTCTHLRHIVIVLLCRINQQGPRPVYFANLLCASAVDRDSLACAPHLRPR
jgi:hypothetical protein